MTFIGDGEGGSGGPPLPPPAPGRDALMDAIKAGKKLKKAPPPKEPKPMADGGGGTGGAAAGAGAGGKSPMMGTLVLVVGVLCGFVV